MRKAKTTTTVVSLIAAALLALLITALLTGCSEADKVNANISKQADYFESERRITVYNARTDKIILEAEGYMSISNNGSSELVVTCKVGPRRVQEELHILELLHPLRGRGHFRDAHRPVPLQDVLPHGIPGRC